MDAREKIETVLGEIRSSLSEFRTIINTIPALAWSSRPDCSVDFVNKRWEEYTGLSSEQSYGKGWQAAIQPEDLPGLLKNWEQYRDCVTDMCEVRLRRFDGIFRWFSLRREPLLDQSGLVTRWFGTGIDIEAIKQRETLHAAEKRTMELIADGASLKDVLDQLCSSIDVQVAPSVTTVLLKEADQECLSHGGGLGVSREWISAIVPVPIAEAGLCGRAAFLKERVIVPDVATDPNWPDQYRDLAIRNRIRAAWSEPILAKDQEVLGTFALYSHESRVPTDEDLALIQGAGHIARIAIERQRSQESLRVALKRIENSETRLRQEERELRQLIDFLPQHVLVLDKDGTLLQANKTMLDYKGLTLEEMKGGGTRERINRDVHPDDLERVQNERSAGLSRGVPFETEKRLLGKDGRFRWFLFRYNPVLNETGDIVRWFATATDVEDRKQAEDRMRNEAIALREQIDREWMFEEIVGSSEALRKVLHQVAKVAPSDSTVLILGDTGTGKELMARAIHKRSSRADRAFIAVNCAAIPPSLIASELFGHEKGAFTGATQRRLGRFESANGGTIFLDEIGDLPADIQIALLRVLQEREIERIGASKPIPVDLRILAATHRDLTALAAEGRFRQDLLYRLNVVPIKMPSLRERKDDIPLLAEYFIGRFGNRVGKKFRTIDKKTLELFKDYSWPGNIRELQNVIERAVILSEGDSISIDEAWLTWESPQVHDPRIALHDVLDQQEREMIEFALAETRGRVSGPDGAAVKLGIPTKTLDSKIKRLGINKFRFKDPRAV